MSFKKIRYSVMTIIAMLFALMIPATMIGSASIIERFDRLYRLTPYSRITGGKTIGKFHDRAGDASKTAGSLPAVDIVRYAVHEPVVNYSTWFETHPVSFWQVSVTLADDPPAPEKETAQKKPVIYIFIDTDRNGSYTMPVSETRDRHLSFEPGHPWNFMIRIDMADRTGSVISADGSAARPVRVTYLAKRRTVYAHMPIDDSRIKSVLDGRPTYHYVMSGIDNGSEVHFLDFMGPNIKASEDQEVNRILHPLEAVTGTSEKTPDAAVIAKLAALAAEEERSEKENAGLRLEKLISSGADDAGIADACIRAEEYPRAEKYVNSMIAADPGNPRVLAYKGLLIAVNAKRSRSPAEAMKMLDSAYDSLDRAVRESEGTDDYLIRYCRGSVSINVPESIFRRSLQGADDFVRAAAILEKKGVAGKKLMSQCYVNAALCFGHAGRDEMAEIYLLKAAGTGCLSRANEKILVEHGLAEMIL